MTEERSKWYRPSDAERAERRAFLEKRRDTGIGGSEIYDLLTGGALSVYHAHTRPILDEDVDGPESIHLLRGKVLEPFALELFARVSGYLVRHEREQITHPDFPGASCSPDGTVIATTERPEGSIEVKAPGWRSFRTLIDLGTREQHVWQAQAAIATRRLTWGVLLFVTLEHDDGPLIPVEIEAQRDVGDFILEVASTFWVEHVQKHVPPDPVEWARLRDKAPRLEQPRERDKSRLLSLAMDQDARKLIQQRVEVDRVIREAGFAREDITAELESYLNDFYSGNARFEVPGVAKVTRVQTRTAGGFDRALLNEHRPVDRDALVRYLMEEHGFEVGKAEGVAEALALNLGHFERPGRPYEFLKVTASRIDDHE